VFRLLRVTVHFHSVDLNLLVTDVFTLYVIKVDQ